MSETKEKKGASLPAEEATTADTPYRRGRWAGRIKFECTRCAYDTLDEQLIRKHVVRSHGVKLSTGEN